MKKVGIKDIAAEAGVSIATVSHAFRNPGRVSDTTRERVLRAADRIGYVPNKLAASLRTARSGNIVVIIPDVTDSFNSGIIGAIEKVARERGYSVLLGDTQGSPRREREFAAMTRSGQADGIILLSNRLPFDAAPGAALPPIVNGCESTGDPRVPLIAIDDRKAAMDATRHLLDYGHRDIAVMTGDPQSPSTIERLAGFRHAMRDAGLEPEPWQIIEGAYTLASGERCARQLLAGARQPSAVFCFSDEIALGCMFALRREGLEVPADVSVMGFDDIPFARYCAPTLTTVAQPTGAIGSACARVLLDLIDGKAPPAARQILPHQLRIRESTRRLA